MIALSVAMNKAEPSEIGEYTTGETFSVDPENSLNLPGQKANAKPIRLIIESKMANMQVVPGEQSGRIEIESKYDKANFKLETKVKEKKDYTEYHISFKNRASILSMAINNDHVSSDDNSLVVKLPKDLLLQIEAQLKMGNYDLDLSGLAVQKLETEMSMGELDIYMDTPNQVAMESMKLEGGMGRLDLYDLQNYGFKKGFIKRNMGEVAIHSSGMLKEDMDLHVKLSMGEARINLPENAILEKKSGAFLGEARFPKAEPDYEGEKATVRLSGGVTMGEYRVGRSNRTMPRTSVLARKLVQEGVDFYLEDMRQLHEKNPDSMELRRSHLNSLGYRLLSNGNKQEAIEVFKLNIELHPNYANGYDSLGEAYMKNNEIENALASYRKSLELDDENDNARRMIKKLEGKDSQPGDESE